jgi:hypothetical protein
MEFGLLVAAAYDEWGPVGGGRRGVRPRPIREAVAAVTADDALAVIRHCGYSASIERTIFEFVLN